LAGLFIPLGNAVEIRNFANPEQQARYETLIQKLRCLVCQNQSLGDSDADLARDLRNEVYGRIQSGESEEETIRFLTDRYGDFVLYDPPSKASPSSSGRAPCCSFWPVAFSRFVTFEAIA